MNWPSNWRLQIADCIREDGLQTEEVKRKNGNVTGRGRERGGLVEERQRQNATNSKRAEPCACIRNAIELLSTGAGPLLSTQGRGRVKPAPSASRAAGKF